MPRDDFGYLNWNICERDLWGGGGEGAGQLLSQGGHHAHLWNFKTDHNKCVIIIWLQPIPKQFIRFSDPSFSWPVYPFHLLALGPRHNKCTHAVFQLF